MLSRSTVLFLAFACVLGLCSLPGCEETASLPDPDPPPYIEPETVIMALARAYNTQDTDLLATLLASEPGAAFRFVPCGPSSGETSSGLGEDRGSAATTPFPWTPPLPPSPLPQEWTRTVNFLPLESWGERPDLYSADGGLDGNLDPRRWRAGDARHVTYTSYDLNDIDYMVEGEANFVIIRDLTKQPSDPGGLLLYMWEELCTEPSALHYAGMAPLFRPCPTPHRVTDLERP